MSCPFKRIGFVALVITGLWAPAVGAATPLEEAAQAYAEFEYDRALSLLESIALDELADSQRARVLLYLGLTRHELGLATEAQDDFAAAIRYDPEVAAPAKTSPKIIRILESRRADERERRETIAALEAAAPPPARRYTWWIGGMGLTGLAVGGVFGALALVAESDFEEARYADTAGRHADRAEAHRRSAAIAAGTGAGLALLSAIFYFWEPSWYE